MKNTLIKWLGGVTQADHEAAITASVETYRRDYRELLKRSANSTVALRKIIACETPSANATVRRMAREAASSVPFTIDSDGLVGLGTDTPSKPLDVKGSDRG